MHATLEAQRAATDALQRQTGSIIPGVFPWTKRGRQHSGRVRLLSRTARDHAARFADVARATAHSPARTLVLDGEVAVFDEPLVSRFDLLSDPGDTVVTPPVYIAFDVLWLSGRDLRRTAHAERGRALKTVIDGATLVYPAHRLVADASRRSLTCNAADARGSSRKNERAPYVSGGTSLWRKVKVRHEGRFVVVGIEVAHDGRQRVSGRERARRGVRYVGGVQWGLMRAAIGELLSRTERRDGPPCSVGRRT